MRQMVARKQGRLPRLEPGESRVDRWRPIDAEHVSIGPERDDDAECIGDAAELVDQGDGVFVKRGRRDETDDADVLLPDRAPRGWCDV